jgi:hypothetical protein
MFFEPEAINCIVQAYEAALAKLGLVNTEDAATRLLAEKIFEVAQAGKRDPVRISERANGGLGTCKCATSPREYERCSRADSPTSSRPAFQTPRYHPSGISPALVTAAESSASP